MLLKRADRAFAGSRYGEAGSLYACILDVLPHHSRATYQLARLQQAGSAAAIDGFRRYVQLEPDDPWGYMALGDALGSNGDIQGALAEYRKAELLQPDADDVLAGQARWLDAAGRIDELVSVRKRRARIHPDRADLWRELGHALHQAKWYQEAAEAYAYATRIGADENTFARLEDARLRAGATVLASGGVSLDSDDVELRNRGLRVDWGVYGKARAGLRIKDTDAEDPAARANALELGFTSVWQPTAAFRVEGELGISRMETRVAGRERSHHPRGGLHLRWHGAHDAPSADLRINHRVITSSPGLIMDPVEVTEARGWLELPLASGFRIRTGGEYARFDETSQDNSRAGYQSVLIHRFSPEFDVSLAWKDQRYGRRSVAPYFSPRRITILELGTYLETSRWWPLTLVVDAGIARQRIERFGEPARRWTMAGRVYAAAEWNLRAGTTAALEYEYNDSPVGGDGVIPASDWSWQALMLTLRHSLPGRTAGNALGDDFRPADRRPASE